MNLKPPGEGQKSPVTHLNTILSLKTQDGASCLLPFAMGQGIITIQNMVWVTRLPGSHFLLQILSLKLLLSP